MEQSIPQFDKCILEGPAGASTDVRQAFGLGRFERYLAGDLLLQRRRRQLQRECGEWSEVETLVNVLRSTEASLKIGLFLGRTTSPTRRGRPFRDI